jgi:hypothetical protein
MKKTFAGMLLLDLLVAQAPNAWAMGIGGFGGLGPGWGIDYGQPASGNVAKHPAKPTHQTKSVKHDRKQVVAH